MKMYRQGDVLIQQHDGEIPKSATEIARERGAVVLAHGEVTGHMHAIAHRGVRFFRDANVRYLEVRPTVALLRHEEHAPVRIARGTYKVTIQREYAEQRIVNVAD